MVFSSSTFLFIFLPVVLILYFALPTRFLKNVFLLIASFAFYAWGEPVYVILMAVSILANWALGLIAGADRSTAEAEAADDGKAPNGAESAPRRGRRSALVAAVVFNVLVIGFFKYEGFLADNINLLLGSPVIPNLELPLPIGISFYTLQALSYVIDVYRGEVPAQRNVLYLGMYIACFPQLIAGPIVRYKTIQEQVVGRCETLEGFAGGMRLFIIGLAKKVLLANTVAILADEMLTQGGGAVGAVGAWAGLIAYSFQIFFDFSGYSDMAIGLGRMMGFSYLRNFNYPYISKSITEFWRRWHISLSTFFRDYIYIPLGGSRCSARRNILNIATVWAITGLWHGAAWNFVLWGVYYGVLLVMEKYVWGRLLAKAPAIVGHVYCLLIVAMGWSFFWIGDLDTLFEYWNALAGSYGLCGWMSFFEITAWEYWPVFVLCAVASTPAIPFLKERFAAWAEKREPRRVTVEGTANPRSIASDSLCTFDIEPATPGRARAVAVAGVLADIALFALLLASCSSVLSGSFNPFIYFQF